MTRNKARDASAPKEWLTQNHVFHVKGKNRKRCDSICEMKKQLPAGSVSEGPSFTLLARMG